MKDMKGIKVMKDQEIDKKDQDIDQVKHIPPLQIF